MHGVRDMYVLDFIVETFVDTVGVDEISASVVGPPKLDAHLAYEILIWIGRSKTLMVSNDGHDMVSLF